MQELVNQTGEAVPGAVFPRKSAAGDEFPPEMDAAARESGALETKVTRKAPETK